jgi:5,6-dimethylbenzimidazole synthase
MNFSRDDAEVLAKIQRWRRDVRHFRREAVPEAVVDRLTGAMDHAPSVGNSRPWRVLRVESAGLRAAVRAEFERCNADAAAAYAGPRRAEYTALKLAGLDTAPLQLAVFSAVDPAAGAGLGRRTMAQTLQQSTAMAIHALWLTARAENLGLGMVSILDPGRIEALFGLGEDWAFAAYLCLGWPESDDDTPLLHRAGWQTNSATQWERR